MGIEVLRPQDCLLHPSSGSFLPGPRSSNYGHQRLHHHQPAAASPRQYRKPAYPSRPEAARKRRSERSLNQPAKFVYAQPASGQLAILKRSQSLASVTKAKKKETAVIISSSAGGGVQWLDSAVSGTGLLGPDPGLIPKQIRLKPAAAGTEYAGSAFEMSPSPRNLPLPSFSWSCSATKDLRRLLRLD